MESALRNFLEGFRSAVAVRAQNPEEEEEELVDPQTVLRDSCRVKPHIASLYDKYQACNDRVNSRSKTTETCAEELMDFVAELDHCVAHHLFAKLK